MPPKFGHKAKPYEMFIDPAKRPDVVKKFWDMVNKSDLGCWLWGDTKTKNYGFLKVDALIFRAHRISWMLNVGPIPQGQWVLHKCDNPPCVRPDHLFVGTVVENVKDAMKKGRHGLAIYTHCKRGHPFEDGNIRFDRRGRRSCITCLQNNYIEKHRQKELAA